MRRRFHACLVVTVACLGGGLASVLIAQGSAAAPGGQHRASAQTSAANRARFTRTLIGYLKKRGFQVNPGYPMLYANDPAERCRDYTYPALKSCFGANPAAPYVAAVVKSWPNEYVERSTQNAFGPLRHGYSVTYRLGSREAIVIYGQMPPPARYFGLQTYEWSQPGHWKTKDYIKWAHDPRRPWPMQYLFTTMPPGHPKSGRVWSFSALGDIVNNVVMQRRSGYPFGKNRYFIITPSATTDRAVRRALQAQGVPGSYIFTEQVPSRDTYGPIGPLGMGNRAIDFTTALRFAVPASPDAARAWRSQLPLAVLRVRAPSSVGPVRRYGALKYEPHAGHSEGYLAGDLLNLVKAVCDRTISASRLYSTDCAKTPPAPYVLPALYEGGLGWIGPYCRSINMNCVGDNNDAAIYWGKPLALDSGQIYAVLDTLATETGNATYVGLSISDASTFSSPVNVLDTGLKGSADRYASTVNNTGKFFVHYFTRDCNVLEPLLGKTGVEHDCTPLSDQAVPPLGDTSAVGHPALKGLFTVALRDYIVPETERGADYSKLLPPRILTFTPLATFQGGGPHTARG
jgi:hypothetical protein